MLKETLIFMGGAITGAALSYFLVKKKYEKEAEKEIEAAKAFYDNLSKKAEELLPEDSPLRTITVAKPELLSIEENEGKEEETYKEIIGKYGYSQMYRKPDLATLAEKVHPESIFDILDPNEDDPEATLHEQVTLQYYDQDNTLTDINDKIIPDIDATIGLESLEHFGEFGEEDIVRVRNNKIKTDYEVIRIHAAYVDYN